MVDLQQRLGIKLTHVPYKGGSDLYNGLLGSQIDAIADASGWIPLVQGGKFRLLVVWGSKRLPLFPEVRTLRKPASTSMSTRPTACAARRAWTRRS